MVDILLAAGATVEYEPQRTATPPAVVVTFPDPALEAAVRDALGLPTGDNTSDHMAGLYMLIARGCDLTDLSGLEYATNPNHLDLTPGGPIRTQLDALLAAGVTVDYEPQRVLAVVVNSRAI